MKLSRETLFLRMTRDKWLLIYIGQQCPFNVHRYDESSHPVTNFEFLSLDSQQLDYKTLKRDLRSNSPDWRQEGGSPVIIIKTQS